MFGHAAPTPTAPPLPDPLPSTPVYASGTAKAAGNNRPGSVGSTIMTSPSGAPAPTNVARKSLLGQ